jgi:hypothetical protein
MARLFITCNNKDFTLGRHLQSALETCGHGMTLPVDAKPAGRWEEQLLRGLQKADALIAILTPKGLGSNWVVGQTAMGIAYEHTENMLVLPVLTTKQIPNFVAAFHCFWLGTGKRSVAVKKLAAELHEAIVAHVAARTPRLFISHRHHDRDIARALIGLLEAGLEIEPGDIRCTSVQGYKLAVGSQSAASLQADLEGAKLVMGIIGPETSKSDYVLFELGASWGLNTPTFPLRVRGATFQHVPEVLREKSSLTLEDSSQCLQLMDDISRVCGIPRRTQRRGGKVLVHVTRQVRKLTHVSGINGRRSNKPLQPSDFAGKY